MKDKISRVSEIIREMHRAGEHPYQTTIHTNGASFKASAKDVVKYLYECGVEGHDIIIE